MLDDIVTIQIYQFTFECDEFRQNKEKPHASGQMKNIGILIRQQLACMVQLSSNPREICQLLN